MASHVPHPWAWVVVGGYVLLVGVVTIVLCVCVWVYVWVVVWGSGDGKGGSGFLPSLYTAPYLVHEYALQSKTGNKVKGLQ